MFADYNAKEGKWEKLPFSSVFVPPNVDSDDKARGFGIRYKPNTGLYEVLNLHVNDKLVIILGNVIFSSSHEHEAWEFYQNSIKSIMNKRKIEISYND